MGNEVKIYRNRDDGGGERLLMTLMDLRPPKPNLSEQVFDKLDLRGAKFTDLDLQRASFRDCNLSGAVFHGCDLQRAMFVDCNLTGARFVDCKLPFAVIQGCILRDALFVDCHLTCADFGKTCNFDGVSFSNSLLDKAAVYGCDLTRMGSPLDLRKLMTMRCIGAVTRFGTVTNAISPVLVGHHQASAIEFESADGTKTRWMGYGCETYELEDFRRLARPLAERHKTGSSQITEAVAIIEGFYLLVRHAFDKKMMMESAP